MSDIAATSIGLVEETTPGTTPANPVFELQNIRDDTIDASLQTVESGDLRTDLNTTGVSPTGQQVGGGYPFGYRFNGIKQPLRGVFGANYAAQPVRENTAAAPGNITGVTGSGALNVATPGGTADSSGYPTALAGHLVLTEGFTGTGNNGVFPTTAGGSATAWLINQPTAEASPPIGASARVVGFDFPSGDLVAVGSGGASAGYVGALTSTSTDFTALGVQPGDMWKLGGATAGPAGRRFTGTAANNGRIIIGAVAAHRLDLLEVPAGWTSDSGTGKTVRVMFGDTLTNSTVKKTFSAEETYSDLGPEYTYSRGMLPNSVALSAPQAAEITGTVGFMGMVQDPPTLSRVSGASTRAAATGQVLTGANTVSDLRIDGATVTGTTFVLQLDMTFERFEAERLGGLYQFGASDLRIGRFRVTGSFRMYYQATTGRAIRAKAGAGTPFSISHLMVDAGGPSGARGEGQYIPQAQYSGVPRQNQNGSRAMNAAWTSKGDNPLGFACRWTRFWYLEL